LLEDFNFAIFHDHSGMRVIVMGSKREDPVTTKTISPLPSEATNQPPSQAPNQAPSQAPNQPSNQGPNLAPTVKQINGGD
jgi:hypothetical protein